MENKKQFYHITLVEEKFKQVFLKYTDENTADALFKDVVKKYSAKSRHYHDMNHICGMCDCWDLFKHKLKNPDEIFMAIIYHDIIYKPTRSDNEEKSADYFLKKVATLLNIDSLRVLSIPPAILSTKHSDASRALWENNLDIQYLLDFDLHVLGTPHSSEYEWYRTGVRKEYKIYPDFMYKPGRKKVLESFLNRKKIYLTEDWKINEKKARKNLQEEIKLYLC